MALYELDGVSPELANSAWVADSAQVIGRVALAQDVSIWFGTVVRGDTEIILSLIHISEPTRPY